LIGIQMGQEDLADAPEGPDEPSVGISDLDPNFSGSTVMAPSPPTEPDSTESGGRMHGFDDRTTECIGFAGRSVHNRIGASPI